MKRKVRRGYEEKKKILCMDKMKMYKKEGSVCECS